MAEANDWNTALIAQFRAGGGRVGGQFAGTPLLLLHHVGRRTGTERVSPLVYKPADNGRMYVFASAGGMPNNPAWYYNIVSAGRAVVEVGTEKVPVIVSEVKGPDRDRIFAEQARTNPGFAAYERRAAGVRTIPVIALDPTG